MAKINNEKVVDYLHILYDGKDPDYLEELRQYGEENKVPIVHREVGELMKTMIKIYKPKRILEIGTAIGYSSILMASVSSEDVVIKTIEIREDMKEIADANIEKYGFDKNIEVLLGDAAVVLDQLDEKFDMVFIDAAKGQYIKYLEKALPLMEEEALIISDNILYKAMIADDSLVVRRKKTIVTRIRRYLDILTSTENLTTSVIPIGDGVAITYKEGECKI